MASMMMLTHPFLETQLGSIPLAPLLLPHLCIKKGKPKVVVLTTTASRRACRKGECFVWQLDTTYGQDWSQTCSNAVEAYMYARPKFS